MAQTTAEFLIEQSMQLGIEQGKAEGKAEVKQKVKQKVNGMQSSNSCSSDFSTCQKRSLAKSAISTTTRLDILLEQAMTAQSLEEIDTHFS